MSGTVGRSTRVRVPALPKTDELRPGKVSGQGSSGVTAGRPGSTVVCDKGSQAVRCEGRPVVSPTRVAGLLGPCPDAPSGNPVLPPSRRG